ncbi:hypothetical protein EDB85DRAFT_2288886 [Lactarius pseudohatsudake]|nr:hypothetical protein EDB85DRAFT_2288886 [Lactarius pseudohatsudake]
MRGRLPVQYFVISINRDWELFVEPEITAQVLGYLGRVEKIRNASRGALPWSQLCGTLDVHVPRFRSQDAECTRVHPSATVREPALALRLGLAEYRPPKRLSEIWGELCAPEMGIPEIRQLTMDHTPAPMKAQLLRLQDLRDGGDVFAFELFMAAVRASKVPDEAHMYVVDEFLTSLGNALVGKNGPHVDEAVSLIKNFVTLCGGPHHIAQKVLRTISRPSHEHDIGTTRTS